MPRTRALAAAAAVLAACGSATATRTPVTTPAPSPSPGVAAVAAPAAVAFAAWLHLTAPAPDGTLELVASDGRVLRSLPGGELTADGGRVVTTAPTASGTQLRVLDAGSGAVLDARTLPAGFRLPTLGPSQRPVALSPGDRFAAVEDRPSGGEAGTVTTTRVAVVDLARGGGTRMITLAGDFDVDALSADGRNLYLIESLAAAGGATVDYRVRRVDVAAGTLDPHVVVDKTDGSAAMTGVPLSRVSGADPAWVLTIYGFGRGGPFVHALGLDAGLAVCVDLPPDPAAADAEEQLLWSIVRDAGGHEAVAVNAGTGQIVEMSVDGGPPTVLRSADLPLASPSAGPQAGLVVDAGAKRIVSTGAVLSPDGATLYAVADTGVVAVDTATLRLTRRLAPDTQPAGLALSPDGATLLLVEANGAIVDRVDTRTGATSRLLEDPTHAVDAIVATVATG